MAEQLENDVRAIKGINKTKFQDTQQKEIEIKLLMKIILAYNISLKRSLQPC